MDPRKPVEKIAGEDAERMDDAIQQTLLKVTSIGCQELKVTGVSFILIAIGRWVMELSDLDETLTRQYLAQLSRIANSNLTNAERLKAEKLRSKLADKIYAAVDIEMSNTEGNA